MKRKRKKANTFSKSKKGTLFDVIPILLIALVFGIFTYVGLKVYNKANENIDFDSDLADEILDRTASTFNLIDNLFIFLLVGMGIATIIAAIRIQTSPAFFFISLLLLSVVIFLAAQFSNVFETFSEHSEFDDERGTLDGMTFLMNNLPLFILGLGLVIVVVMYSVSRGSI